MDLALDVGGDDELRDDPEENYPTSSTAAAEAPVDFVAVESFLPPNLVERSRDMYLYFLSVGINFLFLFWAWLRLIFGWCRKLAELGYKRSAKKCKEKFENVHKYYKRTKEGRAGCPGTEQELLLLQASLEDPSQNHSRRPRCRPLRRVALIAARCSRNESASPPPPFSFGAIGDKGPADADLCADPVSATRAAAPLTGAAAAADDWPHCFSTNSSSSIGVPRVVTTRRGYGGGAERREVARAAGRRRRAAGAAGMMMAFFDGLMTSSSRWPKSEVIASSNSAAGSTNRYKNQAKGPLWREISAGMQRLAYSRSAKRCKEKWENINKYFKKVKESNKKEENEDAKNLPYFHQLTLWYRSKYMTRSSSSDRRTPALISRDRRPTSSNKGQEEVAEQERQWQCAERWASAAGAPVTEELASAFRRAELRTAAVTKWVMKKPEDIVKELMGGGQSNNNDYGDSDNMDDDEDEDDEDEDDEDGNGQFRIQFQRQNVGVR
ncbi:LOW QUALITY PROTEIN: uncharacterized protein LOC109819584 [Asparagus officinalis]|uniref:LOW QUALITY PROTEIN: uncharacterized protein LOC109819584 n=1 Tax=Asparagus officinalis TaxID=4686 RepID=UPI00098DEDF0|nr:LOW QUALITY PROTEIN: uncharacterized protein LOC109819584 [Asparagus officinalis]